MFYLAGESPRLPVSLQVIINNAPLPHLPVWTVNYMVTYLCKIKLLFLQGNTFVKCLLSQGFIFPFKFTLFLCITQ